MTQALNVATTEFERLDRCADLSHRPRVLLGKMGLDGHDRGVKVIARALRDSGVHVIYSGLWQTPKSLAISARDEDCDVVCASMMSNSHLVLGPKLVDELARLGRPDLPVYMGGILPQDDLPKLAAAGIVKCFTTGTGLLDIVKAVRGATFARAATIKAFDPSRMESRVAQLARDISIAHGGGSTHAGSIHAGSIHAEGSTQASTLRAGVARRKPRHVLGITGSPGAGKSTLVAQMVTEYTRRSAAGDPTCPGRCAVVAYDPMSPITNGALLGDRLRVDFNTLGDAAYYHSLAISGEDYASLPTIIELIGGACEGNHAFETLFVETVGAGQNETRIRQHVGKTAVVLTPGMGDAVQMDKAGILEIADVFVCNKADHPGENELVRDLREVAGRRPIVETVATRSQGVTELLDTLLA